MHQTEIDMSRGAILPKLVLFIVPLALSNVLQVAFNAADLAVVGRCLGDVELAAVGSNNSIVSLLVCLISGLTLGVGVLVSRHYGAKDDEKIRRTIGTSLVAIAVGSIFFSAIGFAFSETILRWTKVPENVLTLSAFYLKIYFAGFPALALYNAAAAILRARGDSRRPLYYLAVAGVLNVALNLTFVLGCGWGVGAVATATVVSEIVSCVLIFRCLSKTDGPFHFEPRLLQIDVKILRDLLYVGVPAGLQSSLFSVSNVVVQGAINTLGDVAMAGNAASLSIETFIYVAQEGVSQAALTAVGQNVGAGSYRRVKRAVFDCVCLEFAVCLVLAGFAIIFRRELAGLYTDDPAAIRAAEYRVVILGSTYFFCGLMSMAGNALRSLGYSIFPAVVVFFCACVLRVAWIAFVFPINPSLKTIYISYPISWFLACVALFSCYFVGRRKAFERLVPPSARKSS